MFYLLIT